MIIEREGRDDGPRPDDVVMNDDDDEQVQDDVEDGEGLANLSLCDASFSAKDSVPTSDHDRISKCTEGVRLST